MSNLVEHARRELRLAGLFDAGSDYGPALAEHVLKLVELFSSEGHSGGTAHMTIALLEKLLRFQPLTPLTNDPDEWMDVGETMGRETWQSRRNSEAFSNDGGVTYYLLDDHEKKITAEPAKNLGQMARAVQQLSSAASAQPSASGRETSSSPDTSASTSSTGDT